MKREIVDALRKVGSSLRQRGLVGTGRIGVRFTREQYRIYRDGAFDRRYGTDTSEGMDLDEVAREGRVIEHSNRYEPSSPKLFAEMMRCVRVPLEEYVFLDLGSGKGRILMLASFYPFRQLVGVEFASTLHDTAERNVRRFLACTGGPNRFVLTCMDIWEFALPRSPLVIFMYDPVFGPLMAHVAAQIDATLRTDPRPLFLLYNNPKSAPLFDGSGSVAVVGRGDGWRVYASELAAEENARRS